MFGAGSLPIGRVGSGVRMANKVTDMGDSATPKVLGQRRPMTQLPTNKPPTDKLPTKLTVVIPARNEKEGIERTIKAIPRAELERMG